MAPEPAGAAAAITFVIPSVLNPGGGGEQRIEMKVSSLAGAFAKAVEAKGPDFARRVMEPDGKTPRQLINVYINGKNAKFSGGMDAKLGDGDEVYILPAVAGGSGGGGGTENSTSSSTAAAQATVSEGLTPRELERFSRQVMLEEIGYNGQLKLGQAKICIVGSGGLGNPIATRLAAMGVGALRIIDRDTIELTNLHRQTLFDEDDVGQVKVEVAARKLRKLAPHCRIEPVPMSVGAANAADAVAGCDAVVDALDSVEARYALNAACVRLGIPFVTGAAVGVSGQAFTVMPGSSACYHCIFPDLDEDSMPTCSVEGVHPSILSIVGGIEVAEAVKVVLGRGPSLSERILHIDLEEMEFHKTRTFRAPECPVCGDGAAGRTDPGTPGQEGQQQGKDPGGLVLEELCGRNRGKRTFAITPPAALDVDLGAISDAARQGGFTVENQGDLGLSLRTDELSVSIMKKGSAVVVGTEDEAGAARLYNGLLGRENR
ncbi:MAG: ThiF family adenylyltransferase [Thaumarchaeota archaeon]|nr:ThiF family adenylyltransferase [Nitrososphaerota archaeon]